jgi:DNA modification methylase
MTAHVLRGDARNLPLPDGSVDLIVTSPPYFGLRSYTDGGQHYAGQIGSEPTPSAWLDNLLDCTREWVRVLKPEGNLFVNLGDKYSGAGRGNNTGERLTNPLATRMARYETLNRTQHAGLEMAPAKSLLGLPWRYAIACTDRLGLILRAEIIWAKPNGLPESVTDRVRRAHEQVFHLVKQPRYYAAVDEIREPQSTAGERHNGRSGYVGAPDDIARSFSTRTLSPLGKLPGSVWDIPSAPLQVPERLGVAHFAAFPPALVRPIVLGWSPPGVCTTCGHGRRPVTTQQRETYYGDGRYRNGAQQVRDGAAMVGWRFDEKWRSQTAITGYTCGCAYTHSDTYTLLPARPAIVLDPFGGTGTTALVASCYGRTGITVDLSADYCRLAHWRVNDPGERARARAMPKPPPIPDGMEPLFTM